jgi:serine/threonine-protein kinase
VEALFSEGKRLIGEGKISEACPKFLASYNLDSQRIGTLLNLADCYERNHQLASAWARYVEAKPLAQRAGQTERAEYAVQHAAALEPRLAHLIVVVPKASAGLTVKRDGVLVEPAAYGVPIAIDAGSHALTATAPGRRAWSTEIVFGKEGEKRTVEVPALVDEKVAAAPVAAPAPTPAPPPAERAVAPAPADTAPAEPVGAPPAEVSHGSSSQGVIGLLIAGVGVVGLGFGTGFGLSALGKKGDAEPYCGQNGTGANDCFGEGVTLRSDAANAATASTIFFAAGATLLVGGVVLWLTAPSSSAARSTDARNLRAGFTF